MITQTDLHSWGLERRRPQSQSRSDCGRARTGATCSKPCD